MVSEQVLGALQRPASCPALDELAPGPGQSISETTRRHLEQCPHCRTELELMEGFLSGKLQAGEATAIDEIVRQTRRRVAALTAPRNPAIEETRAATGFKPWLALAAALLIGLVGIRMLTAPDGATLLDPVQTTTVRQAPTVTLLSPVGEQDTVPRQLRWEVEEGATRYEITLSRIDGEPIWSGPTTVPVLDLGVTALAAISPARRLQWEVTAFGSDGAVVARSQKAVFWLRVPDGQEQQ